MPTNFSATSLPVSRRRLLALPAAAAAASVAAPLLDPDPASATSCAPRRLVDKPLPTWD